MANKATVVGLIVLLLLAIIGLTVILHPSSDKINVSVPKRNQINPGEGRPLDISRKPPPPPTRERPQKEGHDRKPKRPDFRENMVEYQGDETYDGQGFAKQVLFKVNNKERISLLAADPKPIDWAKPYVLLLHDAQEEARVWDDLGTMEALVNAGYRTRALNLPGRGETTTFQSNIRNKGKWLSSVMDDYGLYPFILVMPSTGSVYGTPFIQSLFEYNNQHALVAVVAVSPTKMPPIAKLAPRPTLFIYGEHDPLYLRDAQRIENQESDHVVVKLIPNANHKCWDNSPEAFNTALVSWLESIDY